MNLHITNRAGRPTLGLFGDVGRLPAKQDVTPRAVAGFLDMMQAYNSTGALRIYEAVDPLMGIDAQQFADQLDAMGRIDTIDLYINSPGGNVFDGLAIYSILNRHPAQKNVHIDGVAASIASVIAMVGDSIEMAEQSKLMMHNASGLAIGNADDMRELADLLDMMTETIGTIYAARSRQSLPQVKKWMDAETWFSAKEAVAKGLADTIAPLKQPGNGHRPPQAEIERALRRLSGDAGPTRREVAARVRELNRRVSSNGSQRSY